ncbi:hypothetical protein CHS0354_040647 [Potamilus streckersoni]|uniref:Uncharacterized protein n=1 Tax=Potamilus streckersoni TaxID=2493646 RepID=A0AAE0TCA7_9BIVA|nr:hypothetical protein CHS0354_040647 [Potamilus streckersoni]
MLWNGQRTPSGQQCDVMERTEDAIWRAGSHLGKNVLKLSGQRASSGKQCNVEKRIDDVIWKAMSCHAEDRGRHLVRSVMLKNGHRFHLGNGMMLRSGQRMSSIKQCVLCNGQKKSSGMQCHLLHAFVYSIDEEYVLC